MRWPAERRGIGLGNVETEAHSVPLALRVQVELDVSLDELLGQRGHVARLARVKHGPVIRRRRGGAPLRKLRLRDHARLVLSEVSVLEIPAAVRALGDLGPVLLAAIDADPYVHR